MLKRTVLIIMAAFVSACAFSADTIDSSHWSYNDIKELVDAGVITKPLTKGVLTRAEAAEYVRDGVNNVLYAAAGEGSGSSAQIKDYIMKLYELVKAYQTDMIKTGQKLDDIMETIGDLKVKKAEIEAKQDKLLSSMGMRINGESSAYMTDLNLFGNKYLGPGAHSERYRPITQYLDLMWSLRANKNLYAEATFRLENLFGGFWGSQDIYGLKRFYITGSYPVSFIVGDYQAKLTPFTLWAVEEERPFESKLFRDKWEMNKRELYLLDNSWPVSGAKVHTIAELFDALDLDMQVQFARLGEAGKTNYRVWDAVSSTFIPVFYMHDQYLLAARIGTDFTTKGMVSAYFNWAEIVDGKDTGNFDDPVLHNYVATGEGTIDYKSEDFGIKIFGEYGESRYTNNRGRMNYVVDSAMKAGAEISAVNSLLKFVYTSVGTSFTAYAAQTRIYDEFNNEEYITQNSTWNIENNPPSYAIGGKIYPFTKLNPAINVSYGSTTMTTQAGVAAVPGNLLGYPVYENSTNPYGDATPNRQGFAIMFEGDYGDSDFRVAPKIGYRSAEEKIGAWYQVTPSLMNDMKKFPRKFSVIEAGGKVSYSIVSLMGGIRTEDVKNNTKTAKVELSSSTIDLGLEVEIMKKKLLGFVGFKQTSWNGYEIYPSQNIVKMDMQITSIGCGLEYKIAKPAILGIHFTTSKIEDLAVITADESTALIGNDSLKGTKMNLTNSFDAQEIGARVSIKF